MFLELAAAICVGHGLTVTLVHGLPAVKLAQKELECFDVEFNLLYFFIHWTIVYSVLTPVTFFRLFQPNYEWITIYKVLIVQSFLEDND